MADHDKRGKFVKGNKAAVGNKGGRPRRVTEERYLAELVKVVTPEKWRAIVRKVAEKAEGGDLTAFRLLAEYVVGKPTQYVNTDSTTDGKLVYEVIYVNPPPSDPDITATKS